MDSAQVAVGSSRNEIGDHLLCDRQRLVARHAGA
jgi:hypothetical protein